MSYSCVMNEGDVQTLRIPSELLWAPRLARMTCLSLL